MDDHTPPVTDRENDERGDNHKQNRGSGEPVENKLSQPAQGEENGNRGEPSGDSDQKMISCEYHEEYYQILGYSSAPVTDQKVTSLVQVCSGQGKRSTTYDSNHLPLSTGSKVMVAGPIGTTVGTVTRMPCRKAVHRDENLPVVERYCAGHGDKRRTEAQAQKEKEGFELCKTLIKRLSLPMRLVAVEFNLHLNRGLFLFSSENRVDFRQLVRELATQLKCRVDMRQIGVRDESSVLGGIGHCGLNLCCNSFLQSFSPVSIRMAKDQNLALNPDKVSGVCGRLMCCLVYEEATYKELGKNLPKIGKTILTPGGKSRVRELDVLGQRVRVQTEDGTIATFTIEEINRFQRGEPAPAPAPSAAPPEPARRPARSGTQGSRPHPGPHQTGTCRTAPTTGTGPAPESHGGRGRAQDPAPPDEQGSKTEEQTQDQSQPKRRSPASATGDTRRNRRRRPRKRRQPRQKEGSPSKREADPGQRQQGRTQPEARSDSAGGAKEAARERGRSPAGRGGSTRNRGRSEGRKSQRQPQTQRRSPGPEVKNQGAGGEQRGQRPAGERRSPSKSGTPGAHRESRGKPGTRENPKQKPGGQ